MNDIKIEQNVPMPPRARENTVRNILAKMEIGNSIVYPANKTPGFRSVASLYGYKISVRKITDDQNRIWLMGKPPVSTASPLT